MHLDIVDFQEIVIFAESILLRVPVTTPDLVLFVNVKYFSVKIRGSLVVLSPQIRISIEKYKTTHSNFIGG